MISSDTPQKFEHDLQQKSTDLGEKTGREKESTAGRALDLPGDCLHHKFLCWLLMYTRYTSAIMLPKIWRMLIPTTGCVGRNTSWPFAGALSTTSVKWLHQTSTLHRAHFFLCKVSICFFALVFAGIILQAVLMGSRDVWKVKNGLFSKVLKVQNQYL